MATRISISPLAGNRIAVESPYCRQMIAAAKRVGGRWDPEAGEAGAWLFPVEALEQVRALLVEAYGEDDRPAPKVRLRVVVPVEYSPEWPAWRAIDTGGALTIEIGGRQCARARTRDGGATVGVDVIVLEGRFRSGGSIRNPSCGAKAGTVFDILRLPEPMARQLASEHPEVCRIVADDGSELAEAAAEVGSNVVQLKREVV